jgi:hypothetical protein
MKQLIDKSTLLYEYFKLKSNVRLLMKVPPQQALVEKHIYGLGFKMTDRGKKTCIVLLDSKKEDWRI